MHTDRPRNEMPPDPPARSDGTCLVTASVVDEPGPTDDDLELIDIRYEQFVAQSRLESLMYEH